MEALIENAFRKLVEKQISVDEYINDLERRIEKLEDENRRHVVSRVERTLKRLGIR